MLKAAACAFLIAICALPALAQDVRQKDAAARDPGGFYRFLHSFAPETAVSVWRGGQRPDLKTLMTMRGFLPGNPVYIRIFKKEAVLEVWLQKNPDSRYELFEVYPICSASGALGPKLKRGDKQAPEGFYEVNAKHLNPNSKYHLAINMGYPNTYDKANGRTGDFLMIHGACVSIGCYAMTNDNIEEVYRLVQAAFKAGQQTISVHAFPFRMNQDTLIKFKDSQWIDFWVNELLPVYDAFDITGVPPQLMVCDRQYQIMNGINSKDLPKDCEPVTPW